MCRIYDISQVTFVSLVMFGAHGSNGVRARPFGSMATQLLNSPGLWPTACKTREI